MLKPILESEASAEVRSDYLAIKSSLDLQGIPIFFAYIGNFPEYLRYITKQLTSNLENAEFSRLVEKLQPSIVSILEDSSLASETTTEWLRRYAISPSLVACRADVNKTLAINLKLVLIFVGLREAVKGWAVAAKKLKSTNDRSEQPQTTSPADLKFDPSDVTDGVLTTMADQQDEKRGSTEPSTQSKELATTHGNAIEINLLPTLLGLMKNDYQQFMKTQEYVFLRLSFEKLILNSLGLLPSIINSPINLVYDLTAKYPDFPELLYLLSEHFPTYAMQRMIFSGYLVSRL